MNDDAELIDGDRTEYLEIMMAFFDNQGITDSIVVLSGISWMTEFFQHHGYHMHLLANAQYAMYAHLEAPFIDLALSLIWSFTFFNTMVLVTIYQGYRLGRMLFQNGFRIAEVARLRPTTSSAVSNPYDQPTTQKAWQREIALDVLVTMLTALVPLCLDHPMEWSFTPCPSALLTQLTNLCDTTVAQHPEIVIVSPVVAAVADGAVQTSKGQGKGDIVTPVVATGVDSAVPTNKGEGKGDTVAPKAKAKPKASV